MKGIIVRALFVPPLFRWSFVDDWLRRDEIKSQTHSSSNGHTRDARIRSGDVAIALKLFWFGPR